MLTWYYQDSLTTSNVQWFITINGLRTLLYVHAKSLTNTNTTQVTGGVEQTCHTTLHHPVDSTKQER